MGQFSKFILAVFIGKKGDDDRALHFTKDSSNPGNLGPGQLDGHGWIEKLTVIDMAGSKLVNRVNRLVG